ncbi:hypothetical protein OIU78_024449 [Salix suchowensis]|nr:hypothetical protein OIU78_024449 [Salix suchowensis]
MTVSDIYSSNYTLASLIIEGNEPRSSPESISHNTLTRSTR